MNPIYSLTTTARWRFKSLAPVSVCVLSASLAASAQREVQLTTYWASPTQFYASTTRHPV